MSNSLKDAMLKAGLVSKEKVEKDKAKDQRKKLNKKGPQQSGVHKHHIHTDCGVCKRPAPDVEYYEHRNRSVDAKWLCLECADRLSIHDDFRQTNQSQQAMSNRFLRQYGPTKKF